MKKKNRASLSQAWPARNPKKETGKGGQNEGREEIDLSIQV